MDVSQSSQTSLPGGRVVDVSHSGPLPLYDLHLRTLNDSYITFFNERLRIEEMYRDNLLRLYQKQRTVDSLLDERLSESGTLRTAWVDVLSSVETEAEVRAALINSLSSEVIQPLVDLKETYERSRKRIKEDVKSSAQQYNDYAENTLPRLRRNYWRRCLDVEDYRQAMAPPPPTIAPASPVISAPIPINATTASAMKAARETTATPYGGGHTAAVNGVVTSSPRGRAPSAPIGPPRARSPSATGAGTTFSDLAHQGKRQLNNLMSLIETKSGVKDKQDTRSEQALKGVKAKRDADDADREYRKGIHAMETLRLRRAKIMEAGFGSLETLVQESAEAVKKVLMKYSDDLTATYSTSSQVASHVQETADYIFPEKDSQQLKQATATQLEASVPKPILYHNFHMGESKHLIMGISLVDYASARGLKDNAVPRIVELCMREIETRGLNAEGIYRISGRQASVFDLAQLVEKDEKVFQFNPMTDDVHCVAGLLKMYLRELPEPIFRVSQAERAQYTQDRDLHLANHMEFLRAKIRRLPPIHQATLRVLLEHLAKIILSQAQNRMDAKNLAVVFGPVVLGDEPHPPDVNVLTLAKDTLMEDMITHVRMLYEGQGPSPRGKSSILPAVQNNSTPAPITGGSSLITVPPALPPRRPSLPTNSLAFPTEGADTSDDFAPIPSLRQNLTLHPSRHRKTPSASTNQSQGSRIPSRTSSEDAYSNGFSAKRAPTPMSPSSTGSTSSHRPPRLDLKLAAGNVAPPSRSPRLASPIVIATDPSTAMISAPVSVPSMMTPPASAPFTTANTEEPKEMQEDHLVQTITIATPPSSSLPATPKSADSTHSFSTAITTPTTELDGHELP